MRSSPVEVISQRVIRAWCARQVKQHIDVTIEGLDRIPSTGPVLIAARHYHHLYDGCLLLTNVPRPTHLLVGLDWVPNRAIRAAMETACHAARWPIVLRSDAESAIGGQNASTNVYHANERNQYLRRAVRDAVSVLRDGHVLVIFPEGYPNIDPVHTPKVGDDDFLPFQSGAAKIVAIAQRDSQTRVAIVPAGLSYQRGPRWQVTLRFGEPLYLDRPSQGVAVLSAVEDQVHRLSAPLTPSGHPSVSLA